MMTPIQPDAQPDHTNAGIDEEMMKHGLALSGFHIEAGARSFSDYARIMLNIGQCLLEVTDWIMSAAK